MFDNHCHVNFLQLIEDTALGFEKLIHELQLSEIGILSCPRSPKTKVEIDLLENIKALYLKERLSIPVYAYAGFVYHGPESEKYVDFAKNMLDMGVDGFKTLEMHPSIYKEVGKGLNDVSFDKFFDYMAEQGVPMVCHVADPIDNWDAEKVGEWNRANGRFYDETFPTAEKLYEETEQMLRKHPDAKIILAHFYFKSEDYEELVRYMETYPNLYLDMTPGSEMFLGFTKDIEKWTAFFIKYAKRIIMGSDLYGAGYGADRHRLVRRFFESPKPFVMNHEGDHMVTPMHLPEEVLADIYGGNAKRLLGGQPKPVNRKKVYAYCVDIAENHMDELNDIGKENLQTFLDYWRD